MTILITAVLVGGTTAGIWYSRTAQGADENKGPMTAKVERGDLRVSVEATGAVASNKDVDIKCRASGEVQILPYDISWEAKPGAQLLGLDNRDEVQALDQVNAALDSDAARVSEAQLTWEQAKLNLVTTKQRDEAALASAQAQATDSASKAKRTGELFAQNLASKEDLETAQTTAALAAANVQTAKAALAELDQQKIAVEVKQHDIDLAKAQQKQDTVRAAIAQQAVDYCTVNAPPMPDNPTGVWTVSALSVQIGTLVQSGTSNVSGGSAVMTLSDLSHIFVLATVDESDIGHVAVDQDVRITADSFKGIEFRGKVVRIATKGVSTNNVVTFEVKVEVLSKNRLLLKPMMTANVVIVSAERKDAILVPMQAVSRKHAETTAEDWIDRGPQVAASGPASAPASAPATRREKHRRQRTLTPS